MRDFLTVYDYGMGGLWRWIEAESEAAIHAKYRDVTVCEKVPDWWAERGIVLEHVRLDDAPDGALASLLREAGH